LAWRGPASEAPAPLQGLVAAAEATWRHLAAAPAGLGVSLRSDLAPGRGLGSSAAAAVALGRAIAAHHPRDLPIDPVLPLPAGAERHAHGNPSGLDAAAVAWGTPVWFQRGQAPLPIAVGGPFHFVVADTGRARQTRLAVAAVARRLQDTPEAAHQAIATLGDLAGGCRSALATGDPLAMGAYMDMAQRELETLGVSSPELETLIRAARRAQAHGAKLTGAGMGGCILALAADPEHQAALASALKAAGADLALPLTLERDPS
ncbi:MAG: mevalonate kinase, partial [Candidatus Sericytochromatia bacterium]